jgi:hypothetical protein
VGYTTAPWLGFGEALAAVAGALTGLLFVALSVKSDVLAASRSLSSRAAETLVLFMISVLIAVFLVAPQPPVALGAELLALAVVSGITLFVLDRRAGHASAQGVAAYIERFSPNTITAVLVGVAALTFLLKAGGGLYWRSRWRPADGGKARTWAPDGRSYAAGMTASVTTSSSRDGWWSWRRRSSRQATAAG